MTSSFVLFVRLFRRRRCCVLCCCAVRRRRRSHVVVGLHVVGGLRQEIDGDEEVV